jgi:hypothetical protein
MTIHKFDIVTITKSTRAKTKEGFRKAEKDKRYLVISTFCSSYSVGRNVVQTMKLFLCDEEGNDNIVTTETCVERNFNLSDHIANFDPDIHKWRKAKSIWMEKNYVPVIVFNHFDYKGFPVTITGDQSAVLVSSLLNTSDKLWLSKDLVHDEDINTLLTSSIAPTNDPNKRGTRSEAVNVRVPIWFAKKRKLFGTKE